MRGNRRESDIIEPESKPGNTIFARGGSYDDMQNKTTKPASTKQPAVAAHRSAIASAAETAIALSLLILVAAVFSPNADAIEVKSLYSVPVPLDPAEPDGRNTAYRIALSQVLIRITGDTAVTAPDRMAELFPNPAQYVTQFRPGPDNTLVVSFDGQALENSLRQAGATIWGSDRPLTLVWLAVDWGQGKREIVAAGDPARPSDAGRSIDRNQLLRARMTEVATQRGIPLVFPLLDTEDRESLSFSDIWGSFDERLLQASRRYQADSILVGRVRPGTLQQNRWSWYIGDDRQQWSGEPEDAVTLLADSLAARFAYSTDIPSEAISLTISGIGSVAAYGTVQRFLENLPGIDKLMINTVVGDQITYEVSAQGGVERLKRALELGSMLEPVEIMQDRINTGPAQPDDGLRNPVQSTFRQTNFLEYLYRAK